MSEIKELGKMLGKDMSDQDTIKTQFGYGDTIAFFELFTDQINLKDRGLRVQKQAYDTTSGISLWGFGSADGYYDWGSGKWGTREDAFLDKEIIRAIHPNKTYIDKFQDNFWLDTSSTNASLTDDGLVFGTNQTASSSIVYMNNEPITTAKLTATSSGTIGFLMSADGTNYEECENETIHTFSSTGSTLYWRATGSNATLSSIKIEINI